MEMVRNLPTVTLPTRGGNSGLSSSERPSTLLRVLCLPKPVGKYRVCRASVEIRNRKKRRQEEGGGVSMSAG
jgi:hypothetical protein